MDARVPKVRIFWGLAAPVALGFMALVLARPALAVDGVIEINQARATAGNITPGDAPGFPVFINVPGSYRLTSNLSVAAGFNAIIVNVDDVTIDLNGFNISGGGGAIADGVGFGAQQNAEVRNGTIRGFSRYGVFASGFSNGISLIGLRLIGNAISGAELQGLGNLVDRCTARNNLGVGIRALGGSLVINSVARGNTGVGLYLDQNGGYGSNVLTGNNGGDANPQVGGPGAFQLGSNVCGSDLVCP